MNPSRELPHPSPSARYMGIPARGRKAPPRLRTTLLAAIALAAYVSYASIKYTWLGICASISKGASSKQNACCWAVQAQKGCLTNVNMVPKPTSDVARIGIIQCTFRSIVQPYTKSPMGIVIAPYIIMVRRNLYRLLAPGWGASPDVLLGFWPFVLFGIFRVYPITDYTGQA